MRLLHKLYANLFGYFWLPCPVCRKEFGGHEIEHLFTQSLICDDGCSYVVCPNPQCSVDAHTMNTQKEKECGRQFLKWSSVPPSTAPQK